MDKKIIKKDIIHDFDNLPENLISKCYKCGAKYNNAEDEKCLNCGEKFYQDDSKPRGMKNFEVEKTIKNKTASSNNSKEKTELTFAKKDIKQNNKKVKGGVKDPSKNNRKKSFGLDKFQKVAISISILTVAISVFYYFVFKSIQYKKAYKECFSYMRDHDKLKNLSLSDLKMLLETCAKTDLVEKWKEEAKEELKIRKEKEEEEEKKKLTIEEMSKVKIIELEHPGYSSSIKRFSGGDVIGKIKNDNDFKITEIRIHYDFYTDKELTNKVGEKDCEIYNTIFYANSTRDFKQNCIFPEEEIWSWFTYKLVYVKY